MGSTLSNAKTKGLPTASTPIPQPASAHTVAVSAPEYPCQICFDDVASPITQFCGATCPVVSCRACLAEHVRVSVTAAFPGVLPKVRCPVCLVPVNKSKWQAIASSDVTTKYVELCRTACSFRTPCCHDATYTHLPRELGATDLPKRYKHPAALALNAELEQMRACLATERQRFSNHAISAKDLVVWIEDTFGPHVNATTQRLILEHELPRIEDEERRAALLLAYHAKYKTVTTRCCGYNTCFNCKSRVYSECACEKAVFDSKSVLECRSCHVTMVKVEGCTAVKCWCGFYMNWSAELQLRDQNNMGLVPVDIFDLKTYAAWESWRQGFVRILKSQVMPRQFAQRKKRIDGLLLAKPCVRQVLSAFAGRAKWRHRFVRMLPLFEKELAERRTARCAARLRQSALFVQAVRKAKWHAWWTRVVKAIRANQFWINYAREHPDEQRALHEDELAMLLPGVLTQTTLS